MRRTDTLIVGGGPAGAAAAILLARGSRAPLLLERKQDMCGTVCGGFLGWDALAALRALGLEPATLGAAPITHVRLIAGKRQAEARLPYAAAGLSRAALDEALLALAATAGAIIERGVTVKRIHEGRADLGGGGEIVANRMIVATGKHNLRGLERPTAGGAVGFRTSVPAPGSLHGWIELHLFRGGYAGLLVQEGGTANLCLSVEAARLREAGGTVQALLAELRRDSPTIAALGEQAATWDAIAGVPYGWTTDTTDTGLYRIGDQAAVIASLAGDGVAVALASGRAAAEAILSGEDSTRFQSGFAARARPPIARAETLRRLAQRPGTAGPALALLRHLPGLTALAGRLTRIGH